MTSQQREMQDITRGLPSKSEKIRRLGARGYTRQQIADFLGLRYQHVRNVLLDAERKSGLKTMNKPVTVATTEVAETGAPFRVPRKVMTALVVALDGSLTIPSGIMADVQFKPGDRITLVKERDGNIKVLSFEEGIRHAQDLVAQFSRPGTSLADELLKMRREEVEKEEQEYREIQERSGRR